MESVSHLLDLQDVDIHVLKAEKSLAETTAKLADDSELATARERVAQLQAKVDELDSSRRSTERTVEELEQKLKAVDSRLYGGTVTNPKELAAAQDERAFTVTRQSEEDDKLLEAMVASDEAEAGLTQATENLDKIESSRPGEQTELREREQRLTEELADLAERRQEYVPLISARLMATYNALRRSKGGVAVARVERKMCQGCRITLPTAEFQRAKSATEVVQCSSCGRILYVD